MSGRAKYTVRYTEKQGRASSQVQVQIMRTAMLFNHAVTDRTDPRCRVKALTLDEQEAANLRRDGWQVDELTPEAPAKKTKKKGGS